MDRTSNKSTCRQQNTRPLKDELAPESPPKHLPTAKHHATVFRGFTATAGCYCHLLLATFAPNAAADNRMPYLLLLLVNRTSNKSTCRQQNTLPLKDELAPESPPKAPADSKTPCHCVRRFYCYCWLLLPLATCYLWPNAAADNRMPYLLLLLVNRTSNKSTCRQQNTTMPTAKHHATEGRTSPRIPRKDA